MEPFGGVDPSSPHSFTPGLFGDGVVEPFILRQMLDHHCTQPQCRRSVADEAGQHAVSKTFDVDLPTHRSSICSPRRASSACLAGCARYAGPCNRPSRLEARSHGRRYFSPGEPLDWDCLPLAGHKRVEPCFPPVGIWNGLADGSSGKLTAWES
jgi:hypothetical protein